MREYNSRAMDSIAQRELLEFDSTLVNGDPRAVPIEEMIELHYGIILQYRNLSKKGHILGITVFEDSIIPVYDDESKRYEPIVAKAGTILVDQRLLASHCYNRLRFTLAHELAHYILHSEYYLKTQSLASKISSHSDMKREKEADALGASILMPQGRIKVAMKRLGNQLERKELIYQMASIFNVSIQAMEIRLQRLGL